MLGPLLQNATPDLRLRSQRVTDAASEALQRVGPQVPTAPFAPIGETLMWLIALEDLLVAACNHAGLNYWQRRNADPHGAVLPGIRYARNAAVHGELVVTITVVNPGAVYGAAAYGPSPTDKDRPPIGNLAPCSSMHPRPPLSLLSRRHRTTLISPGEP
jgi:hypothetical protein